MGKAVVVLRWIGLLPAWLLASLMAGAAFMLVQWLGGTMVGAARGSTFFTAWLVAARAVFCGVAGMIAVACVAPAAKRESAFAVAAMLATVTAILLAMLLAQWSEGAVPTMKLIWVALDGVPAVVAGFVVASRIPHGCDDACILSGGWLAG